MGVTDLLNRLEQEAQDLPEVIVPVFSPLSQVAVIIHKHPYRLTVGVDHPGWWVIKPVTSSMSKVVREAQPYEVLGVMRKLSRLRVIAVRRLRGNSWMVFPYNLSDARTRALDQPQRCLLVSGGVTPFASFWCRLWGDVLVFDPSSIFSAPGGWLEALGDGYPVPLTRPGTLTGVSPEYRAVWDMLSEELKEAREKAMANSVEGRIKDAVGYLGGELLGYTELGEGYQVRWRDGGTEHVSRVDTSLRLLSAGICLDDREYEQTLASTVAVMRRYRDDEDDY